MDDVPGFVFDASGSALAPCSVPFSPFCEDFGSSLGASIKCSLKHFVELESRVIVFDGGS